jgi:hypothetical protein
MGLNINIEVTMPVSVYGANYTHNVTPMWKLAGVYEALYMSDKQKAQSLIFTLSKGIKIMQDNPDDFIALNPENGWGSYETALAWLIKLRDNCIEFPEGNIEISA